MGLFGDIFKTITAPARFVAKSPLGQIGKMAAPMVMGPAGIGVSAGIGALERSDEGVDDMLGGGLESGVQGAASYGMGKGVGALIGKMGGAGSPELMGAGAPGTEAMARSVGALPPTSTIDPATGAVIDRAISAGAPSPAAGGGAAGAGAGGGIMDKLGLGDIPPWLKWSMLLKGGTDLAGTAYDIYDNERARGRGENFASALVGDQTSRRRTPTNYGSSYDPAGDIMRRRRRALEQEF